MALTPSKVPHAAAVTGVVGEGPGFGPQNADRRIESNLGQVDPTRRKHNIMGLGLMRGVTTRGTMLAPKWWFKPVKVNEVVTLCDFRPPLQGARQDRALRQVAAGGPTLPKFYR